MGPDLDRAGDLRAYRHGVGREYRGRRVVDSFWVTYEVAHPSGLHRLWLVSYIPATNTLGTRILVDSNSLNHNMSPAITTEGSDIHLIYSKPVDVDDPATEERDGCSQPGVEGGGDTVDPGALKHARVDPTTTPADVDIDTVGNAMICTNYGKKSIISDDVDDEIHACWTAKRGTPEDNEVRCATLPLPGTTWSAIEELTGSWATDGLVEDHPAVAADPANGGIRRAWHTDAPGDDVARLQTFRPNPAPLSFQRDFGVATKEINDPALVTRPADGGFVLLFGETGAGIKLVECLAGNAATCASDSAWTQWNGTAIAPEQIVAGTNNKFADLTVGTQTKPRYWVNFEHVSDDEVGVAFKCSSASGWTIEDPSAGTDPEVNERRGTPHIARRARPVFITPSDDIGIVFRRTTETTQSGVKRNDAIFVWANDGTLAACP